MDTDYSYTFILCNIIYVKVHFDRYLKKYATSVYTRLFHEHDPEPRTDISSVQETPDESNVNEDDDEEEDFRKCLHHVMTKLESNTFDYLAKSSVFNAESEFAIYEAQKKRSENLDRLYDALRSPLRNHVVMGSIPLRGTLGKCLLL